MKRNIIRLYNGGFNYSFNLNYMQSEDGLDIETNESPEWVEGAVMRSRDGKSWININHYNPNYVNDVLGSNCK